VLIGKRNVNCLSCAKEPGRGNGTGKDGRIYHNTHKKDGENDGDGLNAKDKAAKKLLNMKWDHIGLNQTNYTNLPNKMSGAALAQIYG